MRAPSNRMDAADLGRRNSALVLAGFLQTARRNLADTGFPPRPKRQIACWLLDNGTDADKQAARDWLNQNRTAGRK